VNKNVLVLLSFLFVSQCFAAEEKEVLSNAYIASLVQEEVQKAMAKERFTINIVLPTTNTNTNNVAATVEARQNASLDGNVGIHGVDLSKRLEGFRGTMSAFLFQNKVKVACSVVCMGYGLIALKLYGASQLLRSQDSWCNWKEAVPLQHLALTPYRDLVAQFNIDLQKKHYLQHSQSPQKKLHVLFWDDLQAEMLCLQNYLKIIRMTKFTCCSRLFFFSHDQAVIEEKLARLQFVFDLFVRMQAEDLK